MKRLPVTLLDGVHHLASPSNATLQLIVEDGINISEGFDFSDPKVLNTVLAAMLTAAEPVQNGWPAKTWTPYEAGSLVDGHNGNAAIDVIKTLIVDSYPVAEKTSEKASGRPTRAAASK